MGPAPSAGKAASIRIRTVEDRFYLNGSAPSNRRLLQPSQRQLPAAAIEWPRQTEYAEAGTGRQKPILYLLRLIRPGVCRTACAWKRRMSNPLSRLATRVAYGASQLPRVAWYVGHSLAVRRLSEAACDASVLESHVNFVAGARDIRCESYTSRCPTSCGPQLPKNSIMANYARGTWAVW